MYPVILSRTAISLLFQYNVNVFFFFFAEKKFGARRLKRSRGRLMRAKMKEREGVSGQRRERTKRGAAETKRRSCRVEHRDVTELIIGFCRDLARAAFFFVGERICISSPSLLPSFAANARVAFNPERLHTKRSARRNSPLPLPAAHFSFYLRCFSRFDPSPFSFLLRSKVMPLLFFFIRASNTSSRAWQLVSVTIPYFTYF